MSKVSDSMEYGCLESLVLTRTTILCWVNSHLNVCIFWRYKIYDINAEQINIE